MGTNVEQWKQNDVGTEAAGPSAHDHERKEKKVDQKARTASTLISDVNDIALIPFSTDWEDEVYF
jgi:hypothetical protein